MLGEAQARGATLIPGKAIKPLKREDGSVRGVQVRTHDGKMMEIESEVLLETLFGLARDGKVGKSGEPSALQLAVIFDEFAELGRPVKPPPAVQKALIAPLAALGRWRGYRARYAEYSSGG